MMILEGSKWEKKYAETKALPNPDDYKTADERELFRVLRDTIPGNP